MVNLPNTMVDLPNTMVDLPNTMVDLPNTMVYIPETIYEKVQPVGLISLSCNWVILHNEIDQM